MVTMGVSRGPVCEGAVPLLVTLEGFQGAFRDLSGSKSPILGPVQDTPRIPPREHCPNILFAEKIPTQPQSTG